MIENISSADYEAYNLILDRRPDYRDRIRDLLIRSGAEISDLMRSACHIMLDDFKPGAQAAGDNTIRPYAIDIDRIDSAARAICDDLEYHAGDRGLGGARAWNALYKYDLGAIVDLDAYHAGAGDLARYCYTRNYTWAQFLAILSVIEGIEAILGHSQRARAEHDMARYYAETLDRVWDLNEIHTPAIRENCEFFEDLAIVVFIETIRDLYA